MPYKKDEITKEAKKIMDNFMKALEGIPDIKEYGLERKSFLREPKEKEKDKGFREQILENAPKTKDEFILAEKKSW